MRPQGSFNIGATARAMQNMGIDRLVIVAPRTEIDEASRKGAATAQGILARRIVYPDLEAFYKEEGSGVKIAFTGKSDLKGGIWNFRDFVKSEMIPRLKNEWITQPIYLVFGSEDDGLSLEELRLMNWLVTLPIFGQNQSLNLAQAVLLAAFVVNEELTNAGLLDVKPQGLKIDVTPNEFDDNLIKKWITTVGFKLEDKRRKSALDVVRRLFLRATPSKEEFKLLADILHQNIRKLEERQDLLTKQTTGMNPIGTIESVFKTRFGTPRQPGLTPSASARLKIKKDLQPGQSLMGLESFSHIWILFQFHENTNKVFRPKIHPPRLEGQTVGIFATRSPHRYNPIGLSLVKLDKIEGDTLFVSGVDLIDGTPVLDIKPYLPEVESIPDAQQGWLDQVNKVKWPVEFDPNLNIDPQTVKLLTEVLENDPRPLVYKEMAAEDPTESQEHAVFLDYLDVHFRFENSRIYVSSVQKL